MLLVQTGETHLFGELVKRHQRNLLKFSISKYGSHSQAEDIVQETFLAAFKARQTYSPEFAFSTWIWTILINLSHKHLQQQQSRNRQLAIYSKYLPQRETSNTLPDAPMMNAEKQQQLHSWLNELPEPQADAIRLRFFGELSYEEISLAMNSSLSGAKRRVKTGLTKLAELVNFNRNET